MTMTDSYQGVYSSTPPSFIVGRNVGGISINGMEYLLDSNNEYRVFPNRNDAKKFIADSIGCDINDEVLEENFYYIPYEKA